MTKLINKFQEGGTAYRASYSLPTININSGRTSENFQRAQNARESEFYQNLIRRVAMNRATNIDYKWLRDNGITSDELNKDVAAHQLNVIDPIRKQQYQRKINNEQQIKRIQNREDYEGLRKGMTVAAAAPFVLSVAGPALGAYGEALKEAPLLTIGQTVGNIGAGMVGGATVNKVTGGWGNWLGQKLGVPEESKVLDYTNPGYFIGLPVNRIATIAGKLFDRLPMLPSGALSRVAVTPEGVQIPVSSGNNRTMNSIRSWIHNKTAPKSTPKAPEPSTTQTSSNNDQLYYDGFGEQIRLFERNDPKAKYYQREYNEKAYKKIPQDKEIYDKNGNLINIDETVPGEEYMYNTMEPAKVFEEVNPVANEYYYRKGYSRPDKFIYELYDHEIYPQRADKLLNSDGSPAKNVFKEITPKNANRYKKYMTEDGNESYTLYDSPVEDIRKRVTPDYQELVENGYPSLREAYKASKNLTDPYNRKILHQYYNNTPEGVVVNDPINEETLRYVKTRGSWLPGNRNFNLTLGGVSLLFGPTRWGLGKALKWSQWTPDQRKQTDTIPQVNTTQDSINNNTLTEKDIEELLDTSAYDY